MLFGIEIDCVLVAAQQVDGIAADAQTRAGDQAPVDGVAHGGIGRTGAFGAHIALGSEAGHQVILRGQDGDDGSLWHGFLHGLQIFRAGVQEQVNVRVNESRQQRAGAQVDGFGAGWMSNGSPGFHDAAVAHQHLSGRDDAAGFDVDQPGGMQHNGARGLPRQRSYKGKQQDTSFEHGIWALWYHFMFP